MKFNAELYNELFHPEPAAVPEGGGIITPEPQKREEPKQVEPAAEPETAEPSEPSEPSEPEEPEGGGETDGGDNKPDDK